MQNHSVNNHSGPGTAAPINSVLAKKIGEAQESVAVFKGVDGVELRGAILGLEYTRLVFEAYQSRRSLQLSQVLDLYAWVEGRLFFSGRAVVRNFLTLGSLYAVEVELNRPEVDGAADQPGEQMPVADTYKRFFQRWQQQAKVASQFKAVVIDLQTYLTGLKLLLEREEAALHLLPQAKRAAHEGQIAKDLAGPVLQTINTLRERLLAEADKIPAELRLAHERLVRRELHPLFLCAPFAFRAFQKPLGYAGDYEMMNMIHRNTFEGETLYAKLVHYWLVNQYPSISVRNRVAHMKGKLVQETIRMSAQKRPIRILNVGCGPAREVGQFMAECPFADRAEFTLVDFDRETLNFAKNSLQEAKTRNARRTTFEGIQMSATQLLKGSAGRAYPAFAKPFDLVYCGGLFDYFTDETCKQLVEMFYNLLTPGGLTVVANMDDRVPYKHMQEYLLDWHLIYRSDRRMIDLVPPGVDLSDWKLVAEQMGVNLFLEVRKPDRN